METKHDSATNGTQNEPDAPVSSEAVVLQQIIAELSRFGPDARRRLINTVCTFYGLDAGWLQMEPSVSAPRPSRERALPFQFSEDAAPSVKRFMHDKGPNTDVERVACLAYYLMHHRAMPHFKTKDITELNTEAAQRRFSNTAFAVENATKTGYLVPSIKGCKQLSASGERFVELLPDRNAAREVMERARPSRLGGRSTKKASVTERE